MTNPPTSPANAPKQPSLLGLLKPYKFIILGLLLLAVISNSFNLVQPKIIANTIDAFTKGNFSVRLALLQFGSIALLIFVFTYLQNIVQTFASEKVGRDLRTELAAKISRQSYAYIQEVTASKLLTHLTSDIDNVKLFVSQAIVSITSSLLLIVGTSVMLLLINWKLALAVLLIIPIIGGTFFAVLQKVRVYFKKGQEVIDWLNKVISESILGSALIRVLNSQQHEYEKFLAANTNAKGIGMSILTLFATLIPTITFVANMATLTILLLGGHFVISGSMTLGSYAGFVSYLAILIFPILMIGFMSGVITRASASYKRIAEVLAVQEKAETGLHTDALKGDIELKDVSVIFGQKSALKDVSLSIKAGTKTAIIGPTAAGKTQLLYLLTGLISPQKGELRYDSRPLESYDREALHRQIGFVFQDSIIFSMTLKENIAFSDTVKDSDLEKAIETAELKEFIASLPEGLNTVVSERGTSLSGGQKQRIMLARALALNPRVLLLDDFTARVDSNTEKKILQNVEKNYPGLTLVSITQKISSIEHYDKVILIMEGEKLAEGTHDHLMHTSPEYVQIFDSQRSTNTYEELHA
ncbi:MAG: ABC transporter ATP-binding protein [Candidatus Peribacteraceae bacterium]|nr:ABC transporter ATP-binding protein [Candidatus Peribacteraceae bacterium]